MRGLLIACLLTLPALAQAPERVVDRFYQSYWNSQDEDKTIRAESRCFTPGLYALLDQAIRLEHQVGGASDAFFVVGNGGWGDWQVGRATVDGNNGIVPLTLWCGLRSDEVRKDPEKRKAWDVDYADVYLTDLGSGWQIYNMKVHRHPKSRDRSASAAWTVRDRAREVVRQLTGLPRDPRQRT